MKHTVTKLLACAIGVLTTFAALLGAAAQAQAQAQAKKPNILFIMGDDIGWFNIGAYHQGIMSGKTPNLDRLAREGMRFTDYYAEASCTAGRANFITGEIPLRTGLTTVGQAGADVGIPAQACTLATALKSQGYATGQFGKNHLGDLNKFLPTVHGFDEFFGYLYHLDAMSDPYWYSYPDDQAYRDKYGPRHLVHCYATDVDDPTEQPRWGRIGKQKIVDEGPLAPYPDMSNVPNMHPISEKHKYDMTTFDEVLVKSTSDFMDKAKKDGKPFFIWHNTTRMHVWTFLSKKYSSAPTTEPKRSPGPTAATRHSKARRAQHSKAVSVSRASSAGRARSSRAAWRTASFPVLIGSPRCAPPPGIQISRSNSSRA
jgi:arylsulfatase